MNKNIFSIKWLSLAWLLFGSVSLSSASVVANFDYGNSTSYVDAFAGKSGTGSWLGAWTISTVSATSPGGTVLTSGDSGYTELTSGSGNYLKISYTSPGGSTASSAAYGRQYGNTGASTAIDLTQSVQYSFSVRADSVGENILICEAPSVVGGSGGTCTWYIIGSAGYWNFISGKQDGSGGANTYSTGIAYSASTTYSFVVTANPTSMTWSGKIYDASGNLLFDSSNTANSNFSSPLKFRSTTTTLGGYISFVNQDGVTSSSETLSLSVDSITITQIPEPQTWAMLMGGMLILAISSRKIRAQCRV